MNKKKAVSMLHTSIVIRIFAVLMLAGIAGVSGCAASGKPFAKITVPADKAVVYIYREQSMVGAAGSMELFVNGEYVTRIVNGGYISYVADPGPVVFKGLPRIPIQVTLHALTQLLDAKVEMYRLNVQPGQEYYLKYNVITAKLDLVTSQTALKKLNKLPMFEDKRKNVSFSPDLPNDFK